MKKIYTLSLIIACVFATTHLLYAQTGFLDATVGLGTANDHVEDGLAAQGYLGAGNNIPVRSTILYYSADSKASNLLFAMPQLRKAKTRFLGAAVGLGTANDHVEDGLAAQGYLEVGKNISVRSTLSYYGSDAKVSDYLSKGTFTMVGVEASALLKASAEGPYIGGGIGYYQPKNELNGTEDDLKSGPGAHAMGGIDIMLGKHLILDLNVKYVYFKIDNEANTKEEEKINLSTLFVTGGIKIRF
jgi:hypothetical protein